ncbi:unnamed protein product [Urochloa decumbens]|uniref:AAA+ ATPase domain-containing protein n=1 Tax=Urochloa decumbens TaxID=240449 RepID=A0ABC9G418_9POAL
MDLSSALASPSPSYGKAVEAYKKAVTLATAAATYTVLARTMARELLPDEVRDTVRRAASAVRDHVLPRRMQRRVKTIHIAQIDDDGIPNRFYSDARPYLGTRVDPHAVDELCLAVHGARRRLSMVPRDTITDVFEGVEFKWTTTRSRRRRRRGDDSSDSDDDSHHESGSLVLCFDAEHTDLALEKYVPFITATVGEERLRQCAIQIVMNTGSFWHGITHHHPATFDTLAMDPEMKRSLVADLDRFLGRREYYRRIGKAWKRGYLLYGPPGTGKSSLVAAMANYLRFKLYDLDLSEVQSNSTLQRLLLGMDNRSILVIEDIDCCFTAKSREEKSDDAGSDSDSDKGPPATEGVTLSGLLNFIDGLWSTSGEQRIIVFTTNYKERLDPALLRPGRMDMHVYMGYCCWDAFKTLARNYFLVDDHPLFPVIQTLLAEVEVTPAAMSEMLLRSDDAGVALQEVVEFLQEQDKKPQGEASRDGK